MKAIEAAEHSDIIYNPERQVVFVKIDGKWVDDNHDEFEIEQLQSSYYVPLVPKKIYKVGDKVTFLEALNSGMCFVGKNNEIVSRVEDRNNGTLVYWHKEFKEWRPCAPSGRDLFEVCTLCDDPSIPPKPTLESLPAWTRCKVRPVNHNSEWQVVKKPSGALMHHYSGKDFEWVNVELVAVYNPTTEQWEEV